MNPTGSNRAERLLSLNEEPSLNAPLGSTLSLRDALRVAFRYQWRFAVFFLLVMTITVVATFTAPEVYESESKLFVRLGRENTGLDATSTIGQQPVVAIPFSRENEINSVVELLQSRAISEAVVDAIGPEVILGPEEASLVDTFQSAVGGLLPRGKQAGEAGGKLTPRDRAILKFEEQRNVDAVKDTAILSLSYDARTPALAQRVMRKIVDEYLEAHVRVNRTPGSHDFLSQQTQRLRQQLTAAEDKLRALKEQTGLVSPEAQRQILVTRIGRLEDELLQAETALAGGLAEASRLHESLQGVAKIQVIGRMTGLDNVAADGARQQLYTLQLQEQELLARFTEEHPEVQQVRRQIAGVQAVLNPSAKPEAIADDLPSRAPLNQELLRREPLLASLEAKRTRLRDQLGSARAELERLDQDALQIARLQREIGVYDANYRRYIDNLEQATIDESLQAAQISNINVIEPATYAPLPVRPRKLLNLVLGCGFAVAGGVALVLLSHYLDSSLRTPEEVETRLGIPALVAIPRLRHRELLLNGKN